MVVNFCWSFLILIVLSAVVIAKEPPITAIAVLDDQHAIVASRAGVRVIGTGDLRVVNTIVGMPSMVHKVIVTPESILLMGGDPAESAWGMMVSRESATDIAGAKFSQTPMPGISNFSDSLFDSALSPDGQRMLLACLDGQAKIQPIGGLDKKDGVTFLGHSSGVTGAVWLGTDTVATSSRDTSIRVWDANTGGLLRTLSQHTGEVTLLQRSPDSPLSSAARPLVASAGLDGTVRFWQPTIGRLVRFCKLDNETACSMAWALDGTSLVVGTDAGSIVWIDPATAATIKRQQVAEDWITAIVFLSPKTILYGTAQGQLEKLAD